MATSLSSGSTFNNFPLPLPLSLSEKKQEVEEAEEVNLFGRVENPAALFAAHDFLAVLDPVRGLRRDLHVATGAHFMFERDHGSVAFAGEEPFEPAQQILLPLPRQLRPFRR